MKKIISSSDAPAAIGPYSQSVQVNGMLYLSGQIDMPPANGELVSDDVREQTAHPECGDAAALCRRS